MWLITIVFGLALFALGPIGNPTFEMKSLTAFIPTAFGAGLVICGVLARNDHLRKQAMHGAVLVGLIGFLIGAIRLAMKLPSVLSEGKFLENRAIQMTTIMTVLCLVFVGLCVNSFIQARRAHR